MTPTPAGNFNRRVTLLSRVTSQQNELGEVVATLQPIGQAWAAIRPLSARELLNAAENTSNVTHEVRLRYTADINHSDALEHCGRTFEIVGNPIDIEEQHRELILLCNEASA